MPLNPEEIEAAALALTTEQSAEPEHALLESFDDDRNAPDSAVLERAWVELADRRYREYLAGEAESIPAEEALARVRPAKFDKGIKRDGPDEAEVERAWIAEAKRRYQEYLSGEVEGIPAAQALAEARAALRAM